jgi:signal transduction histidine kinase
MRRAHEQLNELPMRPAFRLPFAALHAKIITIRSSLSQQATFCELSDDLGRRRIGLTAHTTTAGKVKVGLALDPHAFELLKEMSSGPRGLGECLEALICTEAARRESARRDPVPDQAVDLQAAGQDEMHQLYERAGGEPAGRTHAEKQLKQRGERLRILHEIDLAILAAQSPKEIAEAAAAGVLRAIGAVRVIVALWQADDDKLEVLAAAGPAHPILKPGAKIFKRPWPWFPAVRQGRVAFVEDLAQEPDLFPEAQAALAQGIRSQTVIPLMVGGQPIGHIALSRRTTGRLPDDELALAQQIADSLAVAIHNARLLEAEHQARQRLETLQAANVALTQSLELDAVLESLLDHLAELIPYDSANVMLRTGDDVVSVSAMRGYERWTDPALTRRVTLDVHTNPAIRKMFSNGQSLLVPDTARHPGWERAPGAEHVQSWLAVPLVVGGKVFGIFSVDKAEAGFFKPVHLRLAEALAPQAAVAIQNARLYAEVKTGREQLQILSRRLVELQEQERRALSRDLHDTSGQSITAVKLALASLRRLDGCPEAIRVGLDNLLQMADDVSEDLHRLAVNLRPASLDRYGLVPALEQLLTAFRRETGLHVDFLADGVEGDRLPPGLETALYRIVQEATTNCARYAQATRVSILVQRHEEAVQVIVEDDGRGFDVEEALRRGRLGLLGMRERAEMLGGMLEIESAPGHQPGASGSATTVYATVPLGQPATMAPIPEEPGPLWSPSRAIDEAGTAFDTDLREAAELARAKVLGDALVDMAAGMTRQANAKDLLAFVLSRSAGAIGCDYAAILLREGREVRYWTISDGYNLQEFMIGQRYGDEAVPVAVQVEQTGDLVVTHLTEDAGAHSAAFRVWGAFSGATIPLVSGGSFLGIVTYVRTPASATFMPSEIEFLRRLAALVSLAMENIHLHEVEARQRDELAQRVGELETLLAMLPVGVAIAYDPDGRVIRANPANEKMLGVRQQANVSLNTGDLPLEADYRVYQNGRELRPSELPMQMAVRGRPVRDMVIDLTRGDGSIVTLLSSAVPLLDAEGKPRGAVGTFVDITELRHALAEAESQREAALEARRTLEALLEYIPEGITIADAPDARIRYVSRYGQELLGAPHADKTAGEVAARWAIYEADGATLMPEECLPLVRAIRDGETVHDQELVQINNRGQALPLLCNAGPIRDRDGNVTGGIVAWRDIGTLKEAQSEALKALQAAEQSERRYHSLFNGMTEGFALHELICDEAGVPVDYRFLAINPAFERLTGLKREAVEGRLKCEVLPGDDPFWLEIYGRVALTGEPARFENHSAALGRWYDVYAFCPAPCQFAVIFTEISERKQDEEKIRRLNQDLERRAAEQQAILDAIPVGLIVYDAAGLIVRINDLALNMLGYRADDWRLPVNERAGVTVQMFYPDGSPCARDAYIALRALRGEIVRHEDQYVHLPECPEKDFWGMFSAGPIWGADGGLAGAVIAMFNTDKLHEANEQLAQREAALQEAYAQLQAQADDLREATEKLEQRVLERTADLVATNAQLSQTHLQLQALSRRVVETQERERYYVADQLYNEAGQVLAALKLHLNVPAEHAVPGQYLAETQRLLDRVMADLHHLATNLRPAALDRLGLASSLQQYVEEWGREHGLTVQFEAIGRAGARLNRDVETAVYRVVQEALMNVAQHAQARLVGVIVGSAGGRLAAIVEDDGVGFDPETAMLAGAIGLLAMRERAESVGGQLTIESTPGRGTSVIIEVPDRGESVFVMEQSG